MNWKKNDLDPLKVRDLAAQFDLDLLTASILLRRDIRQPHQLPFYLEEDLRYCHNPFLFEDMDIAVERLLEAAEEKEKVLVFGDRDVDGITGTVLLLGLLREIGLDPEWKVPLENDDYGLSIDLVEEFAGREGTLIVTVDCGITNVAEVDKAGEYGIDVIILDHHNPGQRLPMAAATINPKLTGTDYPFSGLSGCGVVSKLSWALKFARTPLYNQTLCLVNIRPANDSFEVEAVKLINLVPSGRVVETLVPGMSIPTQSRFVEFVLGCQLVGYHIDPQIRMFQRVFGEGVDIHMNDIEPEMASLIPSIRGKSLLRLKEMSRMARYGYRRNSELDVLISLFQSFVNRKYRTLFDAYRNELDLVALSTVADMMPLQDENRILVKQGLEIIRKNPNPGLRELLIQLNLLGSPLETKGLSWQVIPVINSAGRLGKADKAVELFLSKEDAQRTRLAEEVADMNLARRRLGDEAWERIYQVAYNSREELGGTLALAEDQQILRGLTGILASRMMNHLKATSIVLCFHNGLISGSIRAVDNDSVTPFLEFCADLFLDSGGHEKAAGFSMNEDRKEAFLERVRTFASKRKELSLPEPEMEIDAEIPLKMLTPDLYEKLRIFEPFGEGNPPLRLLSRGLSAEEISLVGKPEKKHARILLSAGSIKWPAMFWNGAEQIGTVFNQGETIDAVYEIGMNHFQGKENLQLILRDVKKSVE